MKKIFLTSGIIVCMACPAFATGFDGDATGEQPGACVYNVIGGEDGSTTLRAQWVAKTYDVTYNPCSTGGTGSVTTDTDGATWGESYTPLTNTGIGAATGYEFLGWSTSSTPSYTRDQSQNGEAVNTGTVDTPWTGANPWATDADLDVYAVCMPKQYDVTYDCGDGSFASGATESDVATYGAAFTLPSVASSCEWTGHTPTAWSCVQGQTSVTPGATWTIDGDVTCTAQWDTNQIDITWDFDGATSTVTEQTTVRCSYGSNVTLPALPTKTGYDFDGWEVVPEATTTEP